MSNDNCEEIVSKIKTIGYKPTLNADKILFSESFTVEFDLSRGLLTEDDMKLLEEQMCITKRIVLNGLEVAVQTVDPASYGFKSGEELMKEKQNRANGAPAGNTPTGVAGYNVKTGKWDACDCGNANINFTSKAGKIYQKCTVCNCYLNKDAKKEPIQRR